MNTSSVQTFVVFRNTHLCLKRSTDTMVVALVSSAESMVAPRPILSGSSDTSSDEHKINLLVLCHFYKKRVNLLLSFVADMQCCRLSP